MQFLPKNILQFNGIDIYCINDDGTYYIAIKPICEALSINFNRQFQTMKAHPILSKALAKRYVVAADNKQREMLCLPKFHVFGWILSIRSQSKSFKKYQWDCYGLLFKTFQEIESKQLVDTSIFKKIEQNSSIDSTITIN